jgi:demethoxyubiquinone hydroxylase (CLK1/Coq7/Cat5 family)
MRTPRLTPRALARGLLRTATHLGEVGAAEMYRAQARRSRDALTRNVLRRLEANEATHACETRARDRFPEPLRRAAEAAARAGGGLLGAATSLAGDPPALAFDLAVESLLALGHRANAALLSPAARASSDGRVLERLAAEEAEHRDLIRDRLGI